MSGRFLIDQKLNFSIILSRGLWKLYITCFLPHSEQPQLESTSIARPGIERERRICHTYAQKSENHNVDRKSATRSPRLCDHFMLGIVEKIVLSGKIPFYYTVYN